jgi:hypothetical protein
MGEQFKSERFAEQDSARAKRCAPHAPTPLQALIMDGYLMANATLLF